MSKGRASAVERPVRKRADARRNEQSLLAAAAAVFVTRGVKAPVREIATQAGVGMGTIYRHFPTRADLVVAVYRHQVETLADAAVQLLAGKQAPAVALAEWMDGFVDFLVTKHGLAGALRSDDPGFEPLHAYFLERLVPACASLLSVAIETGQIRNEVDALALMHAAGNLCIGVEVGSRTDDTGSTGYDAHRMVGLLIAGLRRH